MAGDFGLQTASGHLTVPQASKEPYPADVEEQFRRDAAEVIARYPQKRSALLPLLHLVQSVDGYVTGRGIDLCAELLDLSTAEVSGVATFYTQYKRHPNGEYTVGVCTNTLCAVMGGDEIWEAVSEHLGIGHDETTEDGRITLERVECNAACDYAPVVMANWEFFDNQTPDSTIDLVDRLRAGEDVAPTRGAAKVCSFKHVSRVLAGFSDGRADEGVGAGPATLLGLEIAKERGWTAPEGDSAHGSGDAGSTPGSTEVTPGSDEAATDKVEPAAEGDRDDAPGEKHEGDADGEAPGEAADQADDGPRRGTKARTRKKPAEGAEPPAVVSTGEGVRGTATETPSPKEVIDVSPPQEATPGPVGRAANVSAQSASVPVDHEAGPAAVAERHEAGADGTDDDGGAAIDPPEDDGTDGKGE